MKNNISIFIDEMGISYKWIIDDESNYFFSEVWTQQLPFSDIAIMIVNHIENNIPNYGEKIFEVNIVCSNIFDNKGRKIYKNKIYRELKKVIFDQFDVLHEKLNIINRDDSSISFVKTIDVFSNYEKTIDEGRVAYFLIGDGISTKLILEDGQELINGYEVDIDVDDLNVGDGFISHAQSWHMVKNIIGLNSGNYNTKNLFELREYGKESVDARVIYERYRSSLLKTFSMVIALFQPKEIIIGGYPLDGMDMEHFMENDRFFITLEEYINFPELREIKFTWKKYERNSIHDLASK